MKYKVGDIITVASTPEGGSEFASIRMITGIVDTDYTIVVLSHDTIPGLPDNDFMGNESFFMIKNVDAGTMLGCDVLKVMPAFENDIKQAVCTCNIRDIMISGCKCGGF